MSQKDNISARGTQTPAWPTSWTRFVFASRSGRRATGVRCANWNTVLAAEVINAFVVYVTSTVKVNSSWSERSTNPAPPAALNTQYVFWLCV